MVDGLYVGFHITRPDLISIGIFLGVGIGVGITVGMGVLQFLADVVKRFSERLQRRAKDKEQ